LAALPDVQVQPDDILTAVQSATSGALAVQVSASTYDPEMSTTAPRARPPQFSFVAAPVAEQETETVARRESSGSRNWGINIGKFSSRYEAERVLLRMALAEMTTLDGAERKVKARASGYEALFTGLTQHSADLACRRLHAQEISCVLVDPS
jgi:D-alanyl-D-alanine carboxypeptidase